MVGPSSRVGFLLDPARCPLAVPVLEIVDQKEVLLQVMLCPVHTHHLETARSFGPKGTQRDPKVRTEPLGPPGDGAMGAVGPAEMGSAGRW